MVGVLSAWFVQRHREGFIFDMPRNVKILLGLYFLIILFSFFRLMADRESVGWLPNSYLISGYLINTFKWVIPGLLLFYGCRTRERAKIALLSILLLGFFLAVQVTREIPASYVFSGANAHRRLKLSREMGYNAVDLSVILAGMSWAMVAMIQAFRRVSAKLLILLIVGFLSYAQALTGGRGGFVAWGFTGLALCVFKWRKYLLLAPLVVILIPVIFPGVKDRILLGFGESDIAGESVIDTQQVTSGRWQIWPIVIDKIGESPILGFGRLAMNRLRLSGQTWEKTGTFFAHPHNAYLEWLLDNGLLGFIPVVLFYVLIITYATSLFRDRNDPLNSAIGGMALAIVTAQLVGSMGAQSFYPKEGTMAMWCAIGLTLRMTVERSRISSPSYEQNYQYYPLPELYQTSYY
jgi:O-antigen ligase